MAALWGKAIHALLSLQARAQFANRRRAGGGPVNNSAADRNASAALSAPESRIPGPPDQPRKPRWRWPAPSTPLGAVLYTVIGSLIFRLILDLLQHVRLSWH